MEMRFDQVTGEWKGKSAGGCGNYPDTVVNNPTYQMKLDSKTADNCVLVELRGPK
jgi:calpain-7